NEPPSFHPYILLNPRIIYSSAAVESFGQPNAGNITAAANPLLASHRNEGRLTFQVAQSRLGMWFAESSRIRGQLEVDFVDFSKASPTVASSPRLRIARVEAVLLDKKLLISMGQDRDLYQPVNHPGINLIGGAFTAGNTGFMRNQLKLIARLGV